jgi:cellulose synthase/poly-beta-1,6-N-acetylglucosamine synthase-like glycosyltransferase
MNGAWLSICATLLFWPLLLSILDASGGLRGRHARLPIDHGHVESCDDFEVLVPIYGAIRYLENIDYLRDYGSKVLLCTTDSQSAEFDAAIDAVAAENSFRVFRGAVDGDSAAGQRSTGGTVRDKLVRDALGIVATTYVVCLDADTTTVRPLGELVGALVDRNLDLVSIKLVPSNCRGVLSRLQRHEYHLAMMLRLVLPWLVSGACHAARTEVHRDVMNRHSLFFQGNDVEVGVLAFAMGYRVGHVPFEVPTTVPDAWRPWLRQRLAWAGGEVRLFIANPQLAVKHPIFWLYGTIVAIVGCAWRWDSLVHPGWSLAGVVATYLALIAYLHRGRWDRYLLLMPLYMAFTSLIISPLGLIWYAKMAWGARNAGLIRLGRGQASEASLGTT